MLINAHDHMESYGDRLPRALNIIEEKEILTLGVSMDPASYDRLKDLARDHPLIKKGFGIHPWMVRPDTSLEGFDPYLDDCDFIGEIGLDRVWAPPESRLLDQIRVLRFFLDEAKKRSLTVNLHTKGCEEEVLDEVRRADVPAPLIHWYSGPLDLVPAYLDLGAYFTISSDFMDSPLTRDLVAMVPMDRILTETDGPGSLEWVRGEYGWPDLVEGILDFLAKEKGRDRDEVEAMVEANFRRCFQES
ncbi:MAG: TatD family hydrolase [Firmicutes bacterium]|nr:TatD family hydrolase [Bacillota bacterium]